MKLTNVDIDKLRLKYNDTLMDANLKKDITQILSELIHYKELVFNIGKLHEREYDFEEYFPDYITPNIDYTGEIIKLEDKCVKEVKCERKALGKKICKKCYEEFHPITSIRKTICGTCVDLMDLERHGWSYEANIIDEDYYDEDDY